MGKTRQEWLDEMSSIEKRWFVFLDRLEERVKEFVEASIPELKETYKNDTDAAKRNYQRLADSIEGQINSVRRKADKVFEHDVRYYYEHSSDIIGDADNDAWEGLEDVASKLEYDSCEPRYKKFEDMMDFWSKKVEDVSKEDLEAKYQAILDEYEQLKDKFTCKQCGSPITIPQIFLTTAHVECPSCQTQNTFEPSSQARQLDYLGQELAEQRTEHVLKAYEDEKDREEAAREKVSDFESDMDDDNPKDKEKLLALKAEYHAIRDNVPNMYKAYLKAKFDEWIKLVPQLAEQNRKVYEGWLADYERRGE
ncbi:MAG: hypothetical protein ACK5KL_20865 [Dysgonomonas sp.]